jgi:hypothetical protein
MSNRNNVITRFRLSLIIAFAALCVVSAGLVADNPEPGDTTGASGPNIRGVLRITSVWDDSLRNYVSVASFVGQCQGATVGGLLDDVFAVASVTASGKDPAEVLLFQEAPGLADEAYAQSSEKCGAESGTLIITSASKVVIFEDEQVVPPAWGVLEANVVLQLSSS